MEAQGSRRWRANSAVNSPFAVGDKIVVKYEKPPTYEIVAFIRQIFEEPSGNKTLEVELANGKIKRAYRSSKHKRWLIP